MNRKFCDEADTYGLAPGLLSLTPGLLSLTLLYILYTDSCRSAHADKFLVKYADDCVLLSLFFGSQQDHGPALRDLVEWCDDSYLKFKVCKTKELVIDVRNHSQGPEKTTIHDQEVEIVTKYTYLGTVFDNKVRYDDNTEVIVKKCQQRLYFLRKLNSFSVDKTI